MDTLISYSLAVLEGFFYTSLYLVALISMAILVCVIGDALIYSGKRRKSVCPVCLEYDHECLCGGASEASLQPRDADENRELGTQNGGTDS